MDVTAVAHIAQCDHCRGLLALLSVEALGIPMPAGVIDCRDRHDDLPAFVDLERMSGLQAAARAFPQTWWHLLTCDRCAEDYEIMRELAAESGRPGPTSVERSPSAAKPPETSAPATPGPLAIPFAMVRQLIGAHRRLGVAYGPSGEIVLLEAENETHKFELSMRHQGSGLWTMQVKVRPPFLGLAVLRFSSQSFESPFSLQGVATMTDIPEKFLAGAERENPHLLLEFLQP